MQLLFELQEASTNKASEGVSILSDNVIIRKCANGMCGNNVSNPLMALVLNCVMNAMMFYRKASSVMNRIHLPMMKMMKWLKHVRIML